MSSIEKEVITRIAPSPTGTLHIGTARTALFNYLYAKKHKGTFIVRIEDTDAERSEEKYIRDILDALQWLGLQADMIVKQSKRKHIYKRYITKLINDGNAYISKEASKKNPDEMVEVIRFKNKNPNISFNDEVRGNIAMDISDLGDFVIARSMDDPLYNLVVVIDDIEMNISHVLRGDDHIANTPRQVALFHALQAEIPKFIHIPLIHSATGGKLSKRKDATSVLQFKEEGYLPQTMVNFLALLGWNTNDTKELYTLKDLIQEFSIEGIQSGKAVFDEKKLRWFQKHYVQQMNIEDIKKEIFPELRKRFPIASYTKKKSVHAILASIKENGPVFSEEKKEIQDGKYDFFFTPTEYPAELLLPKQTDDTDTQKVIMDSIKKTYDIYNAYNGIWKEEEIKNTIWEHAETQGKATVLWPLRVALSGREKSPGPFLIAEVLGKKETLSRIKKALTILEVYYKK